MSSPGVLQGILRDHWSAAEPLLERRLPAAVASAAREAVTKALRCRTEESGFVRYRCEACRALHTVCFTCKGRFCPSCGRVRAAEAATEARGRLLNVRHRHLIFAAPSELRPLLFADRRLLGVVAKAAAHATLAAFGKRCRKHPPVPGVMATVHTYGRDLGFHVHVHVLCTEGGLRADNVWQPVTFFPIEQYGRLWQHFLLTGLRKHLKGRPGQRRWLGSLYRKYPQGFVVNVTSRYRNGRQAAAYCCRYTGRPPLSERRISAYDGHHVRLDYRNFRDGQEKQLTLPAAEFLLRLLQHVGLRYQRAVHYYGLYQPARRKARARAVARASRFGDQVLPFAPLSRRERLLKALGERAGHCPTCGGKLKVEQVHFPKRHRAKPTLPTRQTRPPPQGTQLPLPM